MYEKHRQNVLGGSTKLFTVYSQYELEQVVHFETSWQIQTAVPELWSKIRL